MEYDISAPCYDSSQMKFCDSLSPGAISQAVYTSGPVSLNGIPGAAGWIFTWNAVSRDLSNSNLNNSNGNGYTLRSIMYPFNNTNTSTCYDNSPQFADPPITTTCLGYPATINNRANDPDQDKLNHSWAAPLAYSTTWPAGGMSWNTGFSVNSPFPGTAFSPNNAPAFIDPNLGIIGYQTISTTVNRIYYAIKVESKRAGVLISEVYREGYMNVISCPPTPTIPPLANNPPSVQFKTSASSPSTLPMPVTDTIFEGDTVRFYLSTTDIQFLPGFIGQSNFITARSTQFGTNYSNPNAGCNLPPCAVVDTFYNYNSNKDHFEGQFGTNMNITWVTDTMHGSPTGNLYQFHFKVQDDWCPNPGISDYTYSVIVYEKATNRIEGTVFIDPNNNGVQDPGEYGLQGLVVNQMPSNFNRLTDSAGHYSIPAYSGNHDVSITAPRYYKIDNPLSGKHTVATSGTNNTYGGKDFALNVIPNIEDLEVNLQSSGAFRPGWFITYTLHYQNIGTSAISSPDLQFSIDSSLLRIDSISPIPNSNNGQVLEWNLSTLNPSDYGMMTIVCQIDSNAGIGDSIYALAQIEPITGDTTPADNIDSLLRVVVNSYDPNNKEANNNVDFVYESSVKNGDFIEYTVNFQNTGTAPAIDVRIEDRLHEDLLINTFEHITASDPVTYELYNRKLIWRFNNINLPDSGSDYLGSMGFVRFRIKADSSLNIGDSIENSVNIFFDQNLPVYAPNVLDIIEEVENPGPGPGPDGISDILDADQFVEVYPNPTEGILNIRFNSDLKGEISYKLFSYTGLLQKDGSIDTEQSGQEFTLDLTSLNSGLYFIQLETDSDQITKRIILK
jgi:uncharacterized repeat protein (TIGR01451 family)